MSTAAWMVVAAVTGLAAGAAGAAAMLSRANRRGRPIDLPDPRRLHVAPTPRGGGIGIVFAGLATMPVAWTVAHPAERPSLLILVLAWALPNGLIGFVDDHHALSPRVKLGLQLVAAGTAVALGLRVSEIDVPPFGTVGLGWLAMPFCALWLVWMANLFNFMDGMDALAAECGAILFLGLAVAASVEGATGYGTSALAVACALCGFLRFNWPPARIFMGDGGSLFAGAMMGGIALGMTSADTARVPLAVSTSICGAFMFDATVTVTRRAMRGLTLRPHRTHFYQRLILAGCPQHRVRLLYVGLTGAGVAGGLVLLRADATGQAISLCAVTMSLFSIVLLTRWAERRTLQRPKQVPS